jgi:hypothetical protein
VSQTSHRPFGDKVGCPSLGSTRRGQRGIRLNTDLNDNSAGVNTSDQEVNIKIMLGSAVAAGRLDLGAPIEQLAQQAPQRAEVLSQWVVALRHKDSQTQPDRRQNDENVHWGNEGEHRPRPALAKQPANSEVDPKIGEVRRYPPPWLGTRPNAGSLCGWWEPEKVGIARLQRDNVHAPSLCHPGRNEQ